MRTALPARLAEISLGLLLVAGLAAAQVLIGGTRLLFSLPSYGLVALGVLLVLPLVRRAKSKPNGICLAASALFFGYIIARALSSPAAYVARTDLYLVLGGLLVYGITATTLVSAKQRMLILGALLLLGLVHVLVGAIQFRDGNNFMPIWFLQRADYGRRASGFYVCPNHLAGLLEVLGIFGVSMVCWSRLPVWLKLLIGYASCIAYAGVMLTGSRGGYLSVGASLLVFLFLSALVLKQAGGSVPWKIAGAAAVLGLLAAAAVFLSINKSSFIKERAGNIADVDNIRVDLWRAAVEQWKLAPLLGTGSATYRYYGRKFRTERMQMDPLETHNDYLQLLCEYGAVGALGFLAFFGCHIVAGWRDFRRLGPKRVAIAPRLLSNHLALNVGALAAAAAYTVHSALDFNLHIPANALLLAFVFGILTNPGVRGGSEPTAPEPGFLAARLGIAAIALLVLVQCARLLPPEYFAERARTALRDDQRASAVLYASQGLRYDTQNPELFAYRGRARIGFGYHMRDPRARISFYETAVDDFTAARSLVPLEEGFALTLGMLYDLLGRFPEGEWMMDCAAAFDPKSEAVRQYYQAHLERWRVGLQPSEPVAEVTASGGK